jgi:transposase
VVGGEAKGSELQPKIATGRPRYEAINREQLCWRRVDVERLIGEEHPARAVWEFVGQLDMSGYQEEARAVEGKAGRPGWDPRLLISLWVYAYGEGVGSARAIEELCEWEPAYQWLTGAVVVNAHTLSDFRVKHEPALQEPGSVGRPGRRPGTRERGRRRARGGVLGPGTGRHGSSDDCH